MCKKKIQIVRQNKTLAVLAKESTPENRLEEETVRPASDVEFHGAAYHILPADLRDLASVESQLSSAGIDFNANTVSVGMRVDLHGTQFSNVSFGAAKKFSTSLYTAKFSRHGFGSVMVDNIRPEAVFCNYTSIKLYIPEATVQH